MTKRISGFKVALAEDIREDDIKKVVTALRMVKGVIGVEPLENSTEDYIQAIRVKTRVRDALYSLITKEL
jgi:hypothetical protein